MISTVDAGDDVSIDAAGSLSLKQDSTNILSWNDAGAVTVSAVSGQDLTMSGDDVVLKSRRHRDCAEAGLHGYPELEQ